MMAGATQLVRAFAGLRVGAVTVGAGPAMGWTKSMSTAATSTRFVQHAAATATATRSPSVRWSLPTPTMTVVSRSRSDTALSRPSAMGSGSQLPMLFPTRGFKSVKRLRALRAPAKRYKMKTKKSVAKRVRRLGNGGLKHWHSNRAHNSASKSKKHRRQARRTGIVKGNLLKLLNKMMINR
eukprot:m.57712 g.57712  ORF g.57712 m.57712 type:complete len:181 (+) comp17131_c0_seq2:22-564(+)